jgi:hypothetical protein
VTTPFRILDERPIPNYRELAHHPASPVPSNQTSQGVPVSGSTGKKLAASVAILAAVGAFVSFGVFSAFTSTKSNTSSITSATFGLTQVPTTLLGTISNLLPGDNVIRCVKVTNTGNVAADVALKPSLNNSTLGNIVTVKVEEVTAGQTATNGTCDGGITVDPTAVVAAATRATLGSSYSLGSWASSGASATHWYRVTVSFPSSAVASDLDTTNLQNQGLSLGMDWVATSAAGGDRSS